MLYLDVSRNVRGTGHLGDFTKSYGFLTTVLIQAPSFLDYSKILNSVILISWKL